MIRVFATKPFGRFASREGISDADLLDAVARLEAGAVDADLGGGVVKQRLARPGQGKSGGFRTLVLFRRGDRAVFAYGFAKNDRANIDRRELKALKALAATILGLDEGAISTAKGNGTLREIG